MARLKPAFTHFPGIGRTILDSHREMPVFEGDMADLEAFDLLPFQTPEY